MTKLEKVISDKRVSEEQYIQEITDLLWERFKYYDMDIEVDDVFKWVKHEHYFDGFMLTKEQHNAFNDIRVENGMKKQRRTRQFPSFKAIYIVRLLNKEDIERTGNEFMFADTSALRHSEELKNNNKTND